MQQPHDSNWGHDDGLGVIGMSLYESSKLLKERVGSSLEPQQIIDHITDGVLSQLEQSIPWRPGARELLKLLRDNNVKTALVTGSMHRMAKKVPSKSVSKPLMSSLVAMTWSRVNRIQSRT